MKNTAALALLLAQASAQDVSRDKAHNVPYLQADAQDTDGCTDADVTKAKGDLTTAKATLDTAKANLKTEQDKVDKAVTDQIAAVLAVTTKDDGTEKTGNKLLAADRAAALDSLAKRIAMNKAFREHKAAEAAAVVAADALKAANTAVTNADTVKKAADRAKSQADAHVTFELLQQEAAVTDLNLKITAYSGNAGGNSLLPLTPDKASGGGAKTFVLKVGTKGAIEAQSTSSGSQTAQAKKTSDALGKVNTAYAATLAAFNRKELMLTAYCVSAIALGAEEATGLAKGAEATETYALGAYGLTAGWSSGDKYARDDDGKYKYTTPTGDPNKDIGGGVKQPGWAVQFGVLTAGTNDDKYRCVKTRSPNTDTAVKDQDDKATTIFAPGKLTIGSNRYAAPKGDDSEPKPALKKAIDQMGVVMNTLEGNNGNGIKEWITASKETMGKFATMIKYVKTDYTDVAGGKICSGSNRQVITQAGAFDSGKPLAAVMDVYGDLLKMITVDTKNPHKADGSKATGNDTTQLSEMKPFLGHICSSLPGYQYYAAAACTDKAKCCLGIDVAGADKTAWLKGGAYVFNGAVTSGGSNGLCWKRTVTKSSDWQAKAAISNNDTEDAEYKKGNSKWQVFLGKITSDWKPKAQLAHTAADTYNRSKRLTTKLAAAYADAYAVFETRYAKWNGAENVDLTGKSEIALYKVEVAAEVSTAADLKAKDATLAKEKAAYETSLAAFQAADLEYDAQVEIQRILGLDATAAKTALEAVTLTQGAADKLTYDTGKKDAKGAAITAPTAFGADKTAKELVTSKKSAYDTAKGLYEKAVTTATNAKKAAETDETAIAKLRKTATDAAATTASAVDAAKKKRDIIDTAETGAQAVVDKAQATLNAKILACKEAKWDTYKSNLTKAEAQRDTDIAAIKKLLKERADAAPKYVKGAGAKGARCEKAMTAGNMGPRRGAMTCTAETDCCGAAKKLDAKTGLLMTVEVCWPKTEKTYKYQPPRGPMQLKMPATEDDWTFACIEGAKKLVAASAALATAAYMMA